MMKTEILILQRILPHYRVGFFDKLCVRFPNTKIFFGQPKDNEFLKNSESLDGTIYSFAKNFYLDKKGRIFFSDVFSKIFRYRPEIIISVFNTGNLNLYLILLLRVFLKYKLILWSFGYDPVNGFHPDKSLKDKLRLFLAQKADAVIFYWEKSLTELSQHSRKISHYFIAPNTLDTETLLLNKEVLDKTGRDEIKRLLKIDEQFHFIYVGRLLKDKQIDLLLKSFGILERKSFNCRLSVIGDGPELEELKQLSLYLNLKNVYFLGEILNDEETGKWIYASDAFVMPGRLGLSVVHAFCYGTPVISQKKVDHHGEGIGYIKDGINGFLVEDGDINELAEKMFAIICDSQLAQDLRVNALATASTECSIKNMLKGFESALLYLDK